MYKIFINEKLIIITSLLKEKESFPMYNLNDVVFEEVIHKLSHTKIKGVYLFSNDVEEGLQQFLNHFKVVVAGGGLVRNRQNEVLFIFRGSRWDLPKGRAEKKETIEETAIREVEEECGISNLTIEKFLLKTHHIYFIDKKPEIKETHWFLMNSDFKGELIPQLEEGITQAVFKTENDIPELFENTYTNIVLVYQKYKELNL